MKGNAFIYLTYENGSSRLRYECMSRWKTTNVEIINENLVRVIKIKGPKICLKEKPPRCRLHFDSSMAINNNRDNDGNWISEDDTGPDSRDNWDCIQTREVEVERAFDLRRYQVPRAS